MLRCLFALAVVFSSTIAIAEQKAAADMSRTALDEGAVPAIKSARFALRRLTQSLDQPIAFEVRFGVNPRSEPQALQFWCPSEFGPENCDEVFRAFEAVGGTCSGEFCTYP